MAENGESKRKGDSLHKAKKAKNDEFYTQLQPIEDELKHYSEHFKGKTVFCNCDDPDWSNFWIYFYKKFSSLGLKKLIATHYEYDKPSYKLEFDGTLDIQKTPLKENGDFKSQECIELLHEADIICTNPPFSLFRKFVPLLIEHDKKFLIIGTMNAITYKEIFPHIKNNNMWLGNENGDMSFKVPDHYPPRETRFWIDETGQKWRSMGNICWFTNLSHDKRNKKLLLYKRYTPKEYSKYENYNAIEVKPVVDIPIDYEGVMGVPISFMDKYNPNQFEIIGMGEDNGRGHSGGVWLGGSTSCLINGEAKFKRIFIKQKK